MLVFAGWRHASRTRPPHCSAPEAGRRHGGYTPGCHGGLRTGRSWAASEQAGTRPVKLRPSRCSHPSKLRRRERCKGHSLSDCRVCRCADSFLLQSKFMKRAQVQSKHVNMLFQVNMCVHKSSSYLLWGWDIWDPTAGEMHGLPQLSYPLLSEICRLCCLHTHTERHSETDTDTQWTETHRGMKAVRHTHTWTDRDTQRYSQTHTQYERTVTHTHTQWYGFTVWQNVSQSGDPGIRPATRFTWSEETWPQWRLTNIFLFPFFMTISNMKRLLSPLGTSRTDCTCTKRRTDPVDTQVIKCNVSQHETKQWR